MVGELVGIVATAVVEAVINAPDDETPAKIVERLLGATLRDIIGLSRSAHLVMLARREAEEAAAREFGPET